jgi:ribosomal protein S18 acetylase RimI-like enzyme
MQFRIDEADLGDPAQASALVEIVDAYASEPGGQNAPLSDQVREGMVRGLASHQSALVLLAYADTQAIGVAICFFGFSTFAARPLINVHDLAVLPAFRGRGAGRALLEEVERRGRERGCCKLTLEVHDTNDGAKRLYADVGFGPWDTPTLFVTRPL